jgi:hypothetical protein
MRLYRATKWPWRNAASTTVLLYSTTTIFRLIYPDPGTGTASDPLQQQEQHGQAVYS